MFAPCLWVDRRIFCVVSLRSAQREAMLEFALLAAAVDGARPFPEPVVRSLRRVVLCDTVAYRTWSWDVGITDRSYAADDLADRWPVWMLYPYFRRDDPHPSEPATRDGDPPPVSAPGHMGRPLVLRDAISDRQLWQSGLYRELMRPFGVRDVMKLFLPREGGGSVLVFDTSSRGFTENDRAAVTRLVPALAQFERNARLRCRNFGATDRLSGLTPREVTVLARAAAGETNAEIASGLFIGDSTVRKHLEHIYEKLEVRNRAAAAAVYTGSDRWGSRNAREDQAPFSKGRDERDSNPWHGGCHA
jgi:DNA-binding CsgD family transcriptional regulator